MNLKVGVLGYSILWMSVLCGTSNSVDAETHSPSRQPVSPIPKVHRLDRLSASTAFSTKALKLPNVAPPEPLSNSLQKLEPMEFSPCLSSIAIDRETFQSNILTAKGDLERNIGETQGQAFQQKIKGIDFQANQKPRIAKPVNSQSQSSNPFFFQSSSSDALVNQPVSFLADDLLANADQISDVTDSETDQGTIQSADSANGADPELGNLQLRERPVPPPPRRSPETVFLLGRLDYFRSDNILLDDFDPVDDQLFGGGITLLAVPDLGPRTQIIASLGGELVRYAELSDLDYNDFQIRAGIRHRLLPRTYGQITWSNQQFFATDGDRILNDHSIRLSLSRRDRIAPQVNLDSFYQFRVSFADPSDRSRISNTLGAYLSYTFEPDWEVGLDYQFVLTDFTQQQREDSYHQLTAQLSYDLSRSTRISLFAGLSFGRSSDPEIDFDSTSLGVTINTSLPLF